MKWSQALCSSILIDGLFPILDAHDQIGEVPWPGAARNRERSAQAEIDYAFMTIKRGHENNGGARQYPISPSLYAFRRDRIAAVVAPARELIAWVRV
jgi:hypothetical protein